MSRLTRIVIISAFTIGTLSCLSPIRRALENATLPEGKPVPQSFTSEEGGFTVGLPPQTPKCKSLSGDGGNRTSCEFIWFVVNMGQFRLGYTDSASDLSGAGTGGAVLQRLRDTAVGVNGDKKMVRDADFTGDGYAGREIVFEGEKGLFVQRFYVAGRRVFDFSVSLPPDYEDKRDEVEKVLDSFRLTPDKK